MYSFILPVTCEYHSANHDTLFCHCTFVFFIFEEVVLGNSLSGVGLGLDPQIQFNLVLEAAVRSCLYLTW